ncbi:MAG: hypothetical protein BWY71_01829 [Planctomycetes bacterium ADurb.Bin412]|nr:MAG: hypothetical protein BWY71_01829 [Planctomycetes bacterium ADurb.Bin412]
MPRLDIAQGDMNLAVLIPRGAGIDYGNRRTPGRIEFGTGSQEIGVGAPHLRRQQGGVVMYLIHVKHMVGRRQDQSRVFGDKQFIAYVHHLGQIGHVHAVAVPVQDIQGEGRHQGVAQGILILGVRPVGTGIVPDARTPFIDDKFRFLFGVILVHDGLVFVDDTVHIAGTLEGFQPFLFAEIRRRTIFCRMAVPVHGQPLHFDAHMQFILIGGAHHDFGGGVPVAVGAAGDLEILAAAVVSHVALIAAVIGGDILRPHIPAAPPAFIADADILYLPGFVPAVLPPHFGNRSNLVAGEVLHPLLHLQNRTAAHITGEGRFAAHLFAQVHKFMGSELVALQGGPDDVLPDGPFAARADAVLPVIAVGKAAAGPANIGAMYLSQRLDDVGTDSPYVGDGRILAYPDAVVDTAAQVFHELPVNVPADGFLPLIGMNQNLTGGMVLAALLCLRQTCQTRQTKNCPTVKRQFFSSLMPQATGACYCISLHGYAPFACGHSTNHPGV